MPSVIRQVEMALLAVYRPGAKKHLATPAEKDAWVFAGRSLEVYLERCCAWARWSHENLGLRRLVDSHLMGQPWVQYRIDSGLSPWTVSADISALRKLAKGIQARWNHAVTLIVPEALAGRQKRYLGARIRRGSYPAHDLRLLRLYIEERLYREAINACLALGLRRHEVVSIQARDVDLQATAFAVKGPGGSWESHPLPPGYHGVVRVRRGKGGRPREVPIPLDYYAHLSDLLMEAVDPTDRLWPVQAKNLGLTVLEACRVAGIPSRGVHGLRHSWALTQYWHLRQQGYDDSNARQTVSWWLGHNRLGVTLSYVPRDRKGVDYGTIHQGG